LRVSTDRQGKSGLGLEAQREAVARYLNGGGWKLVAEYVETESGKRDDRPKLKAALSHAKAMAATVVVAKLDRLSRNTRFLLDIIESGADVVFCDLPQIPPIIAGLQAEGVCGAHALARELNVREIPTPRGGQWWPTTAGRLLGRCQGP
jgi:hypothetical protein